MKHAIILPDGAADEPVAELGGRTPLEAANIPLMNSIAETGRIGTVRTVPENMIPGSDVATMSLLGYDPQQHYTGRAPIEAVARNHPLADGDVVFRCNLVSVVDGRMDDFTAGHIGTAEASAILADLNRDLSCQGVRFFPGVSYRNLMVIGEEAAAEVACMPPHDMPHELIADYRPKGRAAARISEIMDRAQPIVANHPVNEARRVAGKTAATDIWLWGQGVVPVLKRFRGRFGVSGAVIAAVDLIRGLGKLLGWKVIDVPGATGYLDTDYAAKGRAAVAALEAHDLVVVHIEAPDEAGHQGDAAAKVAALEKIDAMIVEPVLERLRAFAEWRILVAPDHPTPVARRTHTHQPPPFCMAGSGIPEGPARAEKFCESLAVRSGLHVDKGHELMEYFLRR